MSKFRYVISAIALVAATGAAAAADLARPYYAAPAQQMQPMGMAGYVWSGAYAGLQAGYTWGKVDWDQTRSFNVNGFSGGVHGGYNWQVNQLVYGLEGSVTWTGADGSRGCTVRLVSGTCSADINWSGDLRARLGYAYDRSLLFVAAGVAYADLKAGQTPTGSKGSTDSLGWTVGLGGEYAITPNVIAGVEYKYTNYGNDNASASITGVNLSTSVLQARLGYKF